MTKLKKNDKTLSEKEKIKQLEEENLYLKAENEYLSSSSRKEAKREEKVKIIAELRAKYPFKTLLKIAGISRTVYIITILIKKILMRRIKISLKKSKKFTTRIKEGMVIAE